MTTQSNKDNRFTGIDWQWPTILNYLSTTSCQIAELLRSLMQFMESGTHVAVLVFSCKNVRGAWRMTKFIHNTGTALINNRRLGSFCEWCCVQWGVKLFSNFFHEITKYSLLEVFHFPVWNTRDSEGREGCVYHASEGGSVIKLEILLTSSGSDFIHRNLCNQTVIYNI